MCIHILYCMGLRPLVTVFLCHAYLVRRAWLLGRQNGLAMGSLFFLSYDSRAHASVPVCVVLVESTFCFRETFRETPLVSLQCLSRGNYLSRNTRNRSIGIIKYRRKYLLVGTGHGVRDLQKLRYCFLITSKVIKISAPSRLKHLNKKIKKNYMKRAASQVSIGEL